MSLHTDVNRPRARARHRVVADRRLDIQALRAVAVLGVVVYHLFPALLPGGFVGVDVFFVISGFLITTHLLSHPPARPADFARFWSRRVLRLLPPVFVVISTTLVAVVLFMPSAQWAQLAREAATSMLYVQNWQLIADATDYLDANRAVSPFQHFWSLSVEEQYYIFWPVLVAALAVIASRAGRRQAVTVFACGFGLVAVASFVFSLVSTSSSPDAAYFSTWTRTWELGIGSVLAAIYPPLAARMGAAARLTTFWLGVVGIALSYAVITGDTPFPGHAALLPTLATALVILAADPDSRLNPRALTHSAPVQFVGDCSYALYLWHWPIIVIAPYVLGRDAAVWDKVFLLVLAVLLAFASTTMVEAPVRRSRYLKLKLRRVFAMGVVITALILVSSLAISLHVNRGVARASEGVQAALKDKQPCFGAAAMDPSNDCPASSTLVTTPEFIKQDVSDGIDSRRCLNYPPFESTPITCTRGDRTDPVKRIALFGNSHAGQWIEALSKIARQHHWQLDTYVIGSCWSMVESQDNDCDTVVQPSVQDIIGGSYDLIVYATADRTPDSGPDKYAATVDAFLESGAHLLVIRDTPAPWDADNPPPDCIAAHLDDISACAGTPDLWIGKDDLVTAANENGSSRVSEVDLNQYICSPTTCPAVAGGVIIFSDYNHLSVTFSKTLAPYLEPAVVDALKGGATSPG